jgi:hypothetical protein
VPQVSERIAKQAKKNWKQNPMVLAPGPGKSLIVTSFVERTVTDRNGAVWVGLNNLLALKLIKGKRLVVIDITHDY